MAQTALIAALGTFDGVHLGHAFIIEELKREAQTIGMVPAIVTFSSHPLAVIRPERAPELLTPLHSKLKMLRERAKTIVLDFDSTMRSMSAYDFMTMLRDAYNVRAMMLGYDTRFGHDRPTEFADYVALGAKAGIDIRKAGEYIGEDTPICSSRIRTALKNGETDLANRMLGHHYNIAGTVTHGKQLGRTIGYPTANIAPECDRQLVPVGGVYAVYAKIEGISTVFPAMLNIGTRPTVDGAPDARRTIEVHLLDFNGDLYGKRIEIEFIDRLRDECRFNSLDELKAQLGRDAEATRSRLGIC